MNIYMPYVYKVTHTTTQQFYIGMRSANTVVAENDLGVHYFTSSKFVKSNFDCFKIKILAYFVDQEAAFEFENNLIRDNWGNSLLLNKHFQTSMSTFSMTGFARPDQSIRNKHTKSKPKESRTYVCPNCQIEHIKVEHSHLIRKDKYCSKRCSNQSNGKKSIQHNKGKKLKNTGRVAWNKGISNQHSAENGKRSAAKQSQTITGRKRKYRDDGSWFWIKESVDPVTKLN